MTRGELRTAVKEWAFDTSDAIASAATCNRWIDLAVKEVCGSANWPFLKRRDTETLSSGGSTVTLNTDCRVVTKVSYTDTDGTKVPLVPAHDRWMQDAYPDDSSTGAPMVYTDGGYSQASTSSVPLRVLRVAPVADKQYTLNISYILTPASLIDDNAVPPFPAGDFDQLIMLWVMRQYARQLQDYDAVNDHQRAYNDELQRLRSQYLEWQMETFSRIQPEDTVRTYHGMVWD